MNGTAIARVLTLFALAALPTACSSGGGSTGDVGTGGNFVVVGTEPLNNGRLFLNDPIRLDFSTPVDLRTADLTTFSFQVFDQNGNAIQEQPTGTFQLDVRPGDEEIGRRLLFVPRFPTNDTYDNGGFRPGRTYLVSLVGGDRRNGTVLRDVNGRGLLRPVTFQFSTADGTSPAQLFRNRLAGGPRRVDFSVTPSSSAGVALNKFGSPPVELRLTFDQPINPNSANIPVALDTNVLVRNINNRGRVFLEYDDPEFGERTWIPADVDVELNDITRSVVLLRPVGVLPNNAIVRVIVENTFEDISGESNVANAAYNRVFASFRTRPSYEPQFDALVEEFRVIEAVDFEAPFVEPQAEVVNGALRASFAFEGTPTTLDYRPRAAEVRLNTDFTQIVPAEGPAFNVSGGVFNFRNVTIPAGVQVIGEGTRPMVWLVNRDFTIAGLLTVRGGNGDRVNVLNSANFPAGGGVGTCGGGNGGRGSPNSTARSMQGEAGFGPGQVPNGGGRPGLISCQGGCGRGSGGGGGSFSTQGDPWYKRQPGAGTSFQQVQGIGGQGCTGTSGNATRALLGGTPGPLAFTDARAENNFWGNGVDASITRPIRIRGELAAPRGGSGGGGGGDLSNSDGCNANAVNFITDNKGGGGGGGGGVLIIKALGRITIERTGWINADGGNGGGGEQAGSCNQGGGGGAGSGGMVILMAGESIDITAHRNGANETYGQNDYDFAVSADGGTCLTGSFSTPNVSGKYPANGQQPMTGSAYDDKPLGAFGGMGIVQLMAPPGSSFAAQTDDTNTVLDDNINFFDPTSGARITGPRKQALIAWRGFPNANGVLVGDDGSETNIGSNEGDIRPTPILLPVPYSAKTRARSKWIDFGAAKRRPLTNSDNLPRGIVEDVPNGLLAGPTYEFAGLRQDVDAAGYVDYTPVGSISVSIDYPEVLPAPATILSATTGGSVEGVPTHRIELVSAVLGSIADRYSQYEASLFDANGTTVGNFRILAHSDRVLQVAAADGVLPANAVSLQVLAKFFEVETNGAPGLGPTYLTGGDPAPIANVRIGFAFHQDPTDPLAQRFPADATQFVYDLQDPTIQEQIRQMGAAYVQWDVLFNTEFAPNSSATPPSFGPSSPRPALRFLRLPFRF